MSDVRSDRCRNTQGFLTKNAKELFWDLNFLSEVTGCRKIQVSERTGSTVPSIFIYIQISSSKFLSTDLSYLQR